MVNLIEKMGMYGLSDEEPFFMAALLTGDPLLMIGSHGCGKTYFGELIAKCLNADFQCYDASKAMFEDILGFPNPKSLAQGSVEYIPTPMSILPKEFALIDEISRAHVQMQNKWLEIIRSRTIMGVKCRKLRWVWAAMNPLSYKGAVPLDEALAGRFSWVLIMPEAYKMEETDAMQVIMNQNADDNLAISKWGGKDRVQIDLPKEEMQELLRRAADAYTIIADEKGAAISQYVVRLKSVMYDKMKLKLDGRRLGMIMRNIISLLAIKRARNEYINIEEDALKVLLRSVPNACTGEEVNFVDIITCHNTVKKALHMKKDVNYLVLMEKNMAKKVALILQNTREVAPTTMKDIMHTIINDNDHLPILCALAPIAFKFPQHFDVDTLTAIGKRMGSMAKEAKFEFRLDKGSILSHDNFQAIVEEAMPTIPGRMAIRIVAEIYHGAKSKLGLEAFNDTYNKVRGDLDVAMNAFQPVYRDMESGTYNVKPVEKEEDDGDSTSSPTTQEAVA